MMILVGQEERAACALIDQAAQLAQRSLCLKSKCGSVIVKDGLVIGEGYNAPPLDNTDFRACHNEYNGQEKTEYDRTCCVHAEQRAIMAALRQHPDKLAGSRLYFIRLDQTGLPKKAGQPFCTVCSRLALDAGIAEFVLWHESGITVYATDDYHHRSVAFHLGDK